MSRSYEEFDEAREIRRATLSIVEGLDQAQSEYRKTSEEWSAGEVLHHLLKLDELIVRELELTFAQRRWGLPFVYRGLADVDTTLPWILKPILPFIEIPASLFNAVFPQSWRRSLTGNRQIPIPAPGIIRPEFGHSIATLRKKLLATFDKLEELHDENTDVDLNRVWYYNSITGLNSAAGMYKFISNHEERHQGQLRDLVGDASFPDA